MATKKDDYKEINITHIINPHMFWFRYAASNDSNDALYQVESRLLKYVHKTGAIALFPTGYDAKNGEIVLVQRNNKWIRGMIDYTIDPNSAEQKYKNYIVWSIDDGWVHIFFLIYCRPHVNTIQQKIMIPRKI